MKKLFWSALAVSLCVNALSVWSQTEDIDEFFVPKSEVLPELKGKQRFSPLDLHQNAEWNVEEKQVELETERLKGQGHSLIAWETLAPEAWLSFDRWLNERSLKDKMPDWKLRLRDDRQMEHVGKILQCRGKCEVYRGSMKAKVQHLSRINEGDELRTDVDTVAWIYLIDGTLLRLSPKSSISFLEINWSKDEVFHLVRLNQGHVYWHPRDSKDYPLELSPETDSFTLPLMIREANQANFERALFLQQPDVARSEEVMRPELGAITSQIQKLNEWKAKNNSQKIPEAKVMMVAPNVTLVSKRTSFDLFHFPGGKSHFKKRNSLEGDELTLQLRGYTSSDKTPITEEVWFEVEANGRSHAQVEKVTGALEITELLTRRIKTIELAREIWIDKYTAPIVSALTNPKELAVQHGYTFWGEELNKRYDFLSEYTRRIETTNLKSMDNLLNKIEGNKEVVQKEMSDDHYKAALNYYMIDLKNRYTDKRMQVREMNDLQYYIWILRHGKKQN